MNMFSSFHSFPYLLMQHLLTFDHCLAALLPNAIPVNITCEVAHFWNRITLFSFLIYMYNIYILIFKRATRI